MVLDNGASKQTDARARAARRAERIAAALSRAELAGYDVACTAAAMQRAKERGSGARAAHLASQLEIEKRLHLRECANLALEMQKGLSDALGDWVLSDDTVGTGLSRRELEVILEVSGAPK